MSADRVTVECRGTRDRRHAPRRVAVFVRDHTGKWDELASEGIGDADRAGVLRDGRLVAHKRGGVVTTRAGLELACPAHTALYAVAFRWVRLRPVLDGLVAAGVDTVELPVLHQVYDHAPTL